MLPFEQSSCLWVGAVVEEQEKGLAVGAAGSLLAVERAAAVVVDTAAYSVEGTQ